VNIINKFVAAIRQQADARRIASRAFVKAVIDSQTASGGPHECQSIPLTHKASCALLYLDEGFVGTPEYLGLAYWWPHEYKHELRAATPKQRKAVHDAILAKGLDLDGVSPEHAAIVKKVTAKRLKKIYG